MFFSSFLVSKLYGTQLVRVNQKIDVVKSILLILQKAVELLENPKFKDGGI